MAATPDVPHINRRELLLAHLDSVYMLARAVAPDDDRAVQLVEATYTQAFVMLPLNHTERDDKRWLFQLLMEVHREQRAYGGSAPGVAVPEDADALNVFRQRLARQIAERALPAIFADLPEPQRLALLLCEVEGLAWEESAPLLDLSPEAARRLLEEAHRALAHGLRTDTAPRERQVLDAYLSEGGLQAALRHTVEAAYGPMPAMLRPAVLAATESATEAATAPMQDAGAEPPPDTFALPDPPRLTLPATGSASKPAPTKRGAFGPPLRRLMLTILLVLTVGLVGYLASQSLERGPENNLIALAVEQADAARPTLPTSSPQRAEGYVQNHLQWRLTLPAIDETTLAGVSIRELTPGIHVPVFLYEDHFTGGVDPTSITLYAFTYALLDRHADRITLEPDIRRQIQEDQRFDLHDLGEQRVLVWRNRDDIYVAVTTGDAEALRQRIVFPS